MIAIRSVLWEDGGKAQYVSWPLYVQRIFLQNLDWTLMIVCGHRRLELRGDVLP